MSQPSAPSSADRAPLADLPVGELVAARPGRSRVFEQFGIDFCCQGGRTLREACASQGVSLDAVVEQLEAEQAVPAPPRINPAELPPAELADHIVETHHGFLRRELPRLHQMAARVAEVHGGHTPSLLVVLGVFEGLRAELESHMMKEEQILFPMVRAIAAGQAVPMSPDGPISRMIHEHDIAGEALARLRALSGGFRPPEEACNTYRALFAGLADLEEDLHRHIHLENCVLFPAAQQMFAAQH